MRTYRAFVADQFVDEAQATLCPVLDPATGSVVAQVALASPALVRHAVQAAAEAQRVWRRWPAIERAQAMRRLGDALLKHQGAIAQALVAESGKSPQDAADELRYGVEVLRYHAEWARRIEGEIIPSDNPNERLYLHREALGVVACLVPFNFPIYTLLRKIGPALITGNAVLVRPSNSTPCSALVLAEVVSEAGFPSGLVNVMAMDHGACGLMCTRPEVAMITLTGSLQAGRQIMTHAQQQVARTSLELGGKTPAIVAADADLELAAAAIVGSRLGHAGQRCTAVERVLVERPVHGRLLALIERRMAAQTWGDRRLNAEHMGPLVSEAARQRVHAMVLRAQIEGAELRLGGQVPSGPGFFYPPTLFSGCTQKMELQREEVFGPVLAVMTCDSLAHALACANDHQYGLASVLFTESHRSAQWVAAEIEAGELYINRAPADPYQGYHAGWKRSGLGGDDGKHGMLEFTQTRLVVVPC